MTEEMTNADKAAGFTEGYVIRSADGMART